MADREHDLLVVGGGIYGACLALEAATAGYRVALVERSDFGSGTSFNSLRIIHGGLRYLQHLDLGRMRESIRARREWLRFAPELVAPMEFHLPTFGRGIHGRWALAVASRASDLVGWDRNSGVLPESQLPGGRTLSRREARDIFGPLRLDGSSGAGCWHDVVNSSSEALLMKVLKAAAERGAQLANYAPALQLLLEGKRVVGARVEDTESGRHLDVRARHVINAAGPWACELLRSAGELGDDKMVFSRAFNLLVRDDRFRFATGLPVRRGSTYFLLPWNGHTLIGTRHLAEYSSRPDGRVSGREVDLFLSEINERLSGPPIERTSVAAVLSGWLPEAGSGVEGQDPEPAKHTRIVDHAARHGLLGLTTVVGVKWTTAREVARTLIAQLAKRIGTPAIRSDRAYEHELGSGLDDFVERWPESSRRVIADQPTTGADIAWAARVGMARKLADVVLRRTHLWLSDSLTVQVLGDCADWMGLERSWSDEEKRRQVLSAQQALEALQGS